LHRRTETSLISNADLAIEIERLGESAFCPSWFADNEERPPFATAVDHYFVEIVRCNGVYVLGMIFHFSCAEVVMLVTIATDGKNARESVEQ